jgi:hypothetical protein
MELSMFGQQAKMVLPKDLKRFYEGDFWSSFFFADTTALADVQAGYFVTPEGQQGQGFGASLSKAETNMQESGRIPTGLALTVRSLAVEPFYQDNTPLCHADLKNLQSHSVIQWKMLNTEIDVAPVSLIGQGGGIFGSTADTGAAEGGSGGSRILLNNGSGQVWTYETLHILLPSSTTFRVVQKFGTNALAVDGGIGNADLIVRIHLLGMVTTAVPVG